MHTVKHDIGLLELVIDAIDKRDPNLLRLALILCDNLTELVMYRRAKRVFAEDDYWKRPPRHRRKEVLKWFEPKIKLVLAETDWLTEDNARFIRFAHGLRNAAYHRNEFHADITLAVVQTYLGLLCRVYPATRDQLITVPSSNDDPFLRKYGLRSAHELLGSGIETIVGRLADGHVCSVDDLARSLSTNLARRIDQVIGTEGEYGYLEMLGRDYGTEEIPPDEVLKGLHFRETYAGKVCKTNEEFQQALAEREAKYAAFQPAVTLATLHRWRTAADNLVSVEAPGDVVSRFSEIDEQFAEVEELVSQAIYEADEWVNSQV